MNKAVELYKEKAEAGNANAKCILGFCYRIARSVIKDVNKAVKLYRESAEARKAHVEFNFGLFFDDGFGAA